MKKMYLFIIFIASSIRADYISRTYIERHYAQGLQGDNKKSSVINSSDAQYYPAVASNPDRYCKLKVVDSIMQVVHKESNIELRLPQDFIFSEDEESYTRDRSNFTQSSFLEDANIELLVTLALSDQVHNMSRKNLEDALLMTAEVASESLLYNLKEISMFSEKEELKRFSMISLLVKLDQFLKNPESREKILKLTNQPVEVTVGYSKKYLAAVGTAAFLIGAGVPSLIAACLSR